MNFQSVIAIFCIVWTTTTFLLSVVVEAADVVKASDTAVMPVGFEAISLNMKLSDFRKSTHAINISSSSGTPDWSQPNQVLFERIPIISQKNSFFKLAVYIFKDNQLQAVALSGRVPQKEMPVNSSAFLKDSLRRYGLPTSLAIVRGDSVVNSPALVWKKEKTLVVASTSPVDSQRQMGILELKIATSSITLKEVFQLPEVSKNEAENILKSVRELLKKTFPDNGVNIPLELISSDLPVKNQKLNFYKQDFSPTWIKGGKWELSFFSLRAIQGDPVALPINSPRIPESSVDSTDNDPPTYNLVVMDKNNSLVVLTKLPDATNFPSWSSNGEKVALENWPGVLIFDVKLVKMAKTNFSRILRRMPSWDSTKERLVMSGSHSPSDQTDKNYKYDQDIFVSEISHDLSGWIVERSWAVARFQGNDILPVFSPDGTWIVFAHEDTTITSNSLDIPNNAAPVESSVQKRWAIYRVTPDKSWDKNEPPEKIVDGLLKPERLEWFPDGKRMLISYPSNLSTVTISPDVLTVDSKKREPLLLPPLFDPELMEEEPLSPTELTVSPDGLKLAFTAVCRTTDKKSMSSFIYVCDLNGSNLRRITPIEETLLIPYQYQQAGITGADIWGRLKPRYSQPLQTKPGN